MERAECVEKVKRKENKGAHFKLLAGRPFGRGDTRTFAFILAYKATATPATTRDASLSRHCYPL